MEDLESGERNFAKKGDFTEITEKKTNLNHITIGAGWDRTNMEEDPVDLDISLFLLNRNDKTREDEDFIFYNNTNALSGAIRHMGDNRTGAGDGDDETIHIDLNGVPFDILKIMIVLSIYDEDMKGHHLKMAKNIFVRILDTDEKEEIIRFEIPDEELTTATAMRVAALVREGPRWFFQPCPNRLWADWPPLPRNMISLFRNWVAPATMTSRLKHLRPDIYSCF